MRMNARQPEMDAEKGMKAGYCRITGSLEKNRRKGRLLSLVSGGGLFHGAPMNVYDLSKRMAFKKRKTFL